MNEFCFPSVDHVAYIGICVTIDGIIIVIKMIGNRYFPPFHGIFVIEKATIGQEINVPITGRIDVINVFFIYLAISILPKISVKLLHLIGFGNHCGGVVKQ